MHSICDVIIQTYETTHLDLNTPCHASGVADWVLSVLLVTVVLGLGIECVGGDSER